VRLGLKKKIEDSRISENLIGVFSPSASLPKFSSGFPDKNSSINIHVVNDITIFIHIIQ